MKYFARVAIVLSLVTVGLWLGDYLEEPSRVAMFWIVFMSFCALANIPAALYGFGAIKWRKN